MMCLTSKLKQIIELNVFKVAMEMLGFLSSQEKVSLSFINVKRIQKKLHFLYDCCLSLMWIFFFQTDLD